jgi:bacteriocin biosynthesis cyclodehydratase domain-containing protein
MILRLDPRLPLVWRNPSGIQLGIDPPVTRIDELTPTQERLLAALEVGVSAPGLAMMAGGRTQEHDQLLALLSPALMHDDPLPDATVALSGSGPLVDAIGAMLAGSGIRVLVAANPVDLVETTPDIAIVAGHFVLDPEAHSLWLRRDVPHLPVVLGDAAIVLGPFIEPGSGPCLLCLELHRRDADEAWPAIATQLLGRRSRAESPILVAEGAASAARMLLERLRNGAAAPVAVRIDEATGARTTSVWAPHPECGCLGLSVSPGLPGSGWATAARLAPAAGSSTS